VDEDDNGNVEDDPGSVGDDHSNVGEFWDPLDDGETEVIQPVKIDVNNPTHHNRTRRELNKLSNYQPDL
jgi:hypothetical protein